MLDNPKTSVGVLFCVPLENTFFAWAAARVVPEGVSPLFPDPFLEATTGHLVVDSIETTGAD